ncbi:unnamed protein product [Bursaphelenchus xylophilus]|uniref:(pine wood nematode) hypothetical protein n=1 Tax=Bursaphelenchus xylophilus TaxID=6326 RepID=A0A1I7SUS5_BURXY|nr:unnamed protein product [Bursaphelenchus xylophilus]CAG9125903.1 unnamed protein product [Bursaphelenchus xylophilus]
MSEENLPAVVNTFNHAFSMVLNYVPASEKYSILLAMTELLEKFCVDQAKPVMVRKLLLNSLNNPDFQDDSQVEPLMRCYKTMSRYSSSMDRVKFMQMLKETSKFYWQYYSVFGEVLLEEDRADEINELFEECFRNCTISPQEFRENVCDDLKKYVTTDVDGQTTALFSTPVETEDTLMLFKPKTQEQKVANLNDTERLYDRPLRNVENSFLLGTPGKPNRFCAPRVDGVKFLDLVSAPHKDLEGVFSVVGYHLARLISGGKMKGVVEPRRVYFNSKIPKDATFGELLKHDLLVVVDDPGCLMEENKEESVRGYLSCMHFLMFGSPLKTRVLGGQVGLAEHYVKSAWLDGIMWSEIFKELLNSNGAVDWNHLIQKLQEFLDDAVDLSLPGYLGSVDEFNRIFDQCER